MLISTLINDPSSWLNAAMADWKYPVDHSALVQMLQYDLQQVVNIKKADQKMYPRPWPDGNKIGGKKGTQRSIEDVRAILRPQSTD